MSSGKQTSPHLHAMSMRAELGLAKDTPIFNLDELITDYNVRLLRHCLTDNVLGACKVEGLHRMIVISDKLTAPTRRSQYRFTLAHEFGHLIIHEESCVCSVRDLQMQVTKRKKEREANQFAAEFLFPISGVKKFLNTSDITFPLIESAAKEYQVSLLSATIRLVLNSHDSVAAFYQIGNTIMWSVKPDFSDFDLVDTVQCNSLAYICGNRMPYIEDYVSPSAWFVSGFESDMQCLEQTKIFSRGKYKLSIVRILT